MSLCALALWNLEPVLALDKAIADGWTDWQTLISRPGKKLGKWKSPRLLARNSGLQALLDSNRDGATPMPKRARKLTCEEFRSYFVEQNNSGADPEDLQNHPHANDCSVCRQFVKELVMIADAARSLYEDERKTFYKVN
jgi:hypothetical protein